MNIVVNYRNLPFGFAVASFDLQFVTLLSVLSDHEFGFLSPV